MNGKNLGHIPEQQVFERYPAGPSRRIERRNRLYSIGDFEPEFIELIETRPEPPLGYVTVHDRRRPLLDCGCAARSIEDIVVCSNPNCRAVTCHLLHADTCPICGRVYCTGCLSQVEANGQIFRLCIFCEQDLTTPKIVKVLSKLIWG